MSAPLVVVIALNWNRCENALACLRTLVGLTYANNRLPVVDNASTDNSTGAIQAQYPLVDQIVSGTNLGFAGGFNIGLRRALTLPADYILIVNNDALAPADLWEPLVAAARLPGVGLAAPIIATRTGSMAEAIGDGLTGFLAEPGNVAGLADAMRRFFCEARAASFRAAIADQRRRFSWAAVVDCVLQPAGDMHVAP